MGIQDTYMTTGEAADAIGCTYDWVRKLCDRGDLECAKIGRFWFVTRASVNAYKKTVRKPGPKPKRR